MNEYKLFVQRIGLTGITNILVALSSLILLPILTKSFSINDYGAWTQIVVTITLIPYISNLGLPFSMVRFLSGKRKKTIIQEGFYSIGYLILISSFITSLFLFLFSENVANALFNGDTKLVILLSLIVFLASLNAFLLNFFRTIQKMKVYSISLLIQTYLGVFISSYFAINGYGIFMASLGLLIANMVTFIFMTLLIISKIGFKFPSFNNLREYLSFGVPTIPTNISYWIVDSSDRYIIGIILGTAFVGYYSPGYTLGNIILMISAPFSLLLPSILPKYYEEDNIEKIRTFLKYSLKYFLLISIPAVFGLSLLSKPILMILTTPEIALNGYTITPFVALSALLLGIYGIISNIIMLKKKTKITGSIWIIAAIINIIFNIILVPYFGISGAAAVTLFSYTLAFGLTLLYSLKFFKFDFDLVFIFKSIVASILMSVIVILINPTGILNVLMTVILSSVIYFALLTIFKGIKREEFNFFKTLIVK